MSMGWEARRLHDESNDLTIKELLAHIIDLKVELASTKEKIREYNGLREKVQSVETKMAALESKVATTMWGVGLLLAIVQIILKFV